jgi:RNase H-fold protein (predicted Holliday junction resolvase)
MADRADQRGGPAPEPGNSGTALRPVWVGFDPGRDKCGLAVVGLTGELWEHRVIPAREALAALEELQQRFTIRQLILGDRTTSSAWQRQIQQGLAASPPITPVDEHNTTLEARDRYWQMYPARGLTRLLPQGLRQPPRPIDDIVAILLVERYLQQSSQKQSSQTEAEPGGNAPTPPDPA